MPDDDIKPGTAEPSAEGFGGPELNPPIVVGTDTVPPAIHPAVSDAHVGVEPSTTPEPEFVDAHDEPSHPPQHSHPAELVHPAEPVHPAELVQESMVSLNEPAQLGSRNDAHDIPSHSTGPVHLAALDELSRSTGPVHPAAHDIPSHSTGPAHPAEPVESTVSLNEPAQLGSPIDSIKSREKRKPSALQLDDVSALPRSSIEVSSAALASAAVSRSRASSRASLQKRPWTPSLEHPPDSPTSSLISSLRQQLELLSDQANLLNTKLVDSISKHADLEDQIFGLQTEKSEQEVKIDELEKAKARWEESMNTGLLVERAQIRDEMQRLAAGLVEEERRRGTEEERRQQVENEVDQLTASLFDQANTMVASERMARVQAEEREKVTIENLAAAEAAMKDMQAHLQTLADSGAKPRSGSMHQPLPRRYLSSHPPYAEFLSLLHHLRALRPRSARARELYPAPAVPNLLAQPFLARAIAEDHEPTLRLEAAPELSWLSRRNVGAAIIAGELLIEPAPAASLGPLDSITCALCGCGVFRSGSSPHNTSRFSLKPFFSPASSQTRDTSAPSTQLYVFRMPGEDAKSYPLCKNGWCLERLRSACALWHFVRTGIVAPVWVGEDGYVDPPSSLHPITVTADDLLGGSGAGGGSVAAVGGGAGGVGGVGAGETRRSVSQPAPSKVATPPAEKKGGWGLGGFKLGGSWSSSRPQTPSTASTDTSKRDLDKSDSDSTKAVIDREDREGSHVPDPDADSQSPPDAAERAETVHESVAETGVPALHAETEVPAQHVEQGSEQKEGRPRSPSFATTESEYSFATPPNEPKALPGAEAAEGHSDAVAGATARLSELEVIDAEMPGSFNPEAAAESVPAVTAETTTEHEAAIESEHTETHGAEGISSGVEGEGPAPPIPPRKRAPPPPPLPKRSERRAMGSAGNTPTAATTPIPGAVTPTTDGEVATPTVASSTVAPDPTIEGAEASTPTVASSSIDEPTETSTTAASDAEHSATETPQVTETAPTPTSPSAEAAESAIATETPQSPSTPRRPPPRHFAVNSSNPGATATAAAEAATSPRSPRSSSYATHERNVASAESSLSPRALTSPRNGAPRVNVRHASNPTTGTGDREGGQGAAMVREKTFLAGDEWEVRTWKAVVRLKEDMWRARIGVVDDV